MSGGSSWSRGSPPVQTTSRFSGAPLHCADDRRDEIRRRGEPPAVDPVHADEIRVAEGADRFGAILLAPRPEVAARETAEHRRAAGLAALALQGEEDLLDRIGHAASFGRPSATHSDQPLARNSQAGQDPQPNPQSWRCSRSPR